MKDELRDAIERALKTPIETASKHADMLAAAIRAEIDERIEARKPEPKVVELRCAMYDAARTIEEAGHDATADTLRQAVDDVCNETAKPKAAKPRRNPYEDAIVRYVSAGSYEIAIGPRSLYYGTREKCEFVRAAYVRIWNEGAQIAGDRDA